MTLLFALAIAVTAVVGVTAGIVTWWRENDWVLGLVIGVPSLLFLAAAVQAAIVRL